MPIVDHPSFQSAPTPQTPLWRYLSFPKFMSLLQRRSLFFCNLEVLAQSDPFEGTLPPSHFVHRQWITIKDALEEIQSRLPSYLPRGYDNLLVAFKNYIDHCEHQIRYAFASRRSYFLNCWHINPHESAAMWDIYSRRDEGIAVVSSEERFRAAFDKTDVTLYAGQIRYEDYSRLDFSIDQTNQFNLILSKRISFEYEQEYRLVWHDVDKLWKTIEPINGYFTFMVHGSRRVNINVWMFA